MQLKRILLLPIFLSTILLSTPYEVDNSEESLTHYNEECMGHISYGYQLEIIVKEKPLEEYEQYTVLYEAFNSYYKAIGVCSVGSEEFLYSLDRVRLIGNGIPLRVERLEADCKTAVHEGLYTVGILDTTLSIDTQYLMLATALGYFEKATTICIVNGKERKLASKYVVSTNEALKNLGVLAK